MNEELVYVNAVEAKTWLGLEFDYAPRVSLSISDWLPHSLNPASEHAVWELCSVGILMLQIALVVSNSYSPQVFLVIYVGWRLIYNVGIGFLLYCQSKHNLVVRLFILCGLNLDPKRRHMRHAQWVARELVKVRERDTDCTYDYYAMPSDMNAWLLFSEICKIVLLHEVCSFVVFAYSFSVFKWDFLSSIVEVCRMLLGLSLVVIHAAFKYHAFNRLKDYSWFWGDFFFILKSYEPGLQPSFDCIPHPMYSIGYLGYYGASLLARSYLVLFTAIALHSSQILFLHLVEKPHAFRIRKYVKQSSLSPDASSADSVSTYAGLSTGITESNYIQDMMTYFSRDLIIFYNTDLFRSSDFLTYFICLYTILSAFLIGPIDNLSWKATYYIGQAMLWRFAHTYCLGLVLFLELKDKFWTRHFIKHGYGLREGFQHWKILYNLSLTMTCTSFLICACRVYVPPQHFMDGPSLLRHIIGAVLIVMHAWIIVSTYKVRGPFEWFYGDFFLDDIHHEPSNQGVYRYFENPLLFTLSSWGLSLICGSKALLAVTVFDQFSNWLFTHFIERPYRDRLNCNRCRRHSSSAVRMTLRRQLLNWCRGIHSFLKNRLNVCVDVIFPDQQPLDESEFEVETQSEATIYHDDQSVTTATDIDEASENQHSDFSSVTPAAMMFLGDHPATSNNSHSRRKSVTDRLRNVVRELEELVDHAKPKVKAIVDNTKLHVVSIANAARLDDALSTDELPLHLYSLSFPTKTVANEGDDGQVVEFELGEPIVIEFTAARETMKRKDWIGLYKTEANFRSDVTTSKCGDKWSYLVGRHKQLIGVHHASSTSNLTSSSMISEFTADQITFYDETTSPWSKTRDGKHRFGRTEVTLTTCNDDPGLRLVRGRIVFSREQLPWSVGMFEARFHYDGKYHVVARSPQFTVCLRIPKSVDTVSSHLRPETEYDDGDSSFRMMNSDEDRGSCIPLATEIAQELHGIIERCIELNVNQGDESLDINESIISRISVPLVLINTFPLKSYQKRVCHRIVYVIKHLYGVEFSYRVVEMARTVTCLAEHVHGALVVLKPQHSRVTSTQTLG